MRDNMRKIFKCLETGEEIIITKQECETYNYEKVRNMNVDDLASILSYANESSLREALRFIAKEKKETFIKLERLFHGRIYDLIRGKFTY
jgi:hypothetical protein